MNQAAKTVVVESNRGWTSFGLDELWEYRELAFFFVWRDVKVRYKQTVLGASWAVLQPFLTMVVFTLVFGQLAGIQTDGPPYPIFSYTALLPWTLFFNGLNGASNSLVGQANLIKKVYFPRMTVPIAAVASGLVDFCEALRLLLAMLPIYGVVPRWQIVFLPLMLLIGQVAALGIGLWLSALNVEFRDVRYVVPFLLQLLMFVSPVIYPASRVLEKLEAFGIPGWLYGLNPAAGVIAGFRWAILRSDTNPWPMLAASAITAALLLFTGMIYFRRMERGFADVA